VEKIKRFIECLVPVSVCNLKCEYCYIIQEDRRKNEMPTFKYSPEHIGKALSKERLGGTSYISICGAGETLFPKEIPEIVENILAQGHYVNITTNGTLTNRFEQLAKMPIDYLERLHFSFSFHYLELLKTNSLQKFIDNVKLMKSSGCSFLVQLNLYDGYLDYIEDIKKICLEEFGAMPQVALTRDETPLHDEEIIKILTKLDIEEYKSIGKSFNSPLFDFTCDNFMVKREEFCYAGDWSFILDLASGNTKKCYFSQELDNIYDDLKKPIDFLAVGKNCGSNYCINSSHFMSLGIIPEIDTPSYVDLRNRKEANWFNKKTEEFLNTKLSMSNKEYSKFKKYNHNIIYNYSIINKKIKKKIRGLFNGK